MQTVTIIQGKHGIYVLKKIIEKISVNSRASKLLTLFCIMT